MLGVLVNLPSKIVEGIGNILKELFIPKTDIVGRIREAVMKPFGWLFELLDNLTMFQSYYDTGEDIPKFTITAYGKTMDIIDFSIFAPYRTFVHSLVLLFAWFNFFKWGAHKLPRIV